MTWFVAGQVANPLPVDPRTHGYAWQVSFNDGATRYTFRVDKSRFGVSATRIATEVHRAPDEPRMPVPTRHVATLRDDAITLRLSAYDFPGLSDGPVRWTGSSSWIREGILDDWPTDVGVLREATHSVTVPPELPLPSLATSLRFFEAPSPQWRGSAPMPMSRTLAAIEDELTSAGYHLSEKTQRAVDQAALSHHTTSFEYVRAATRGTISLTEVRVRDRPVEVLVTITPAS